MSPTPRTIPAEIVGLGPIIFFDGYCHLCAGVVKFVLKHDRSETFKFAALQGQTARRLLDSKYISDHPGTVVFWDGVGLYSHSAAALRILVGLGGLFRLWTYALLIPEAIRDRVYNFVARHRYAWFGRSETCQFSVGDRDVRFLP